AGEGFTPPRQSPTGERWLCDTADRVRVGVQQRYGDAAVALLDSELSWQAERMCHRLVEGVIHGDYFCDNILFDGDDVSGVIDFYYAHNAPFVLDVAISINALALRLQDGDRERQSSFLRGYEGVRPLTGVESAALPGLLRLAALRFWLSRLFDLLYPRGGAMTQVKDPEEYRRKLLLHRGGQVLV
ncbi:MAG: homoserine kinase, partial [Mariprofundales bacterium]|nr:homoserine kinase [Mariprofundales bacterium]